MRRLDRRRPGRRRLALGAAVLALLVAGCGVAPPDPAGQTSAPMKVDVNTPALRQARAEIGVAPCPRMPAREPVAGGMPDVTLPCLGGGREVAMGALRGPMVINLWQSFCGPCREEMPALEEFSDRYGAQVPVLGIDFEDTRPEAAIDLLAQTGATYPSVADPSGSLSGRGAFPVVRGMPMFVLIDEDGVIARVQAGGVTEVGQVEDMVEDHLGVRLPRG